MRRITHRICDSANKIRRQSGKHLFFHFMEESGYLNGKFWRRKLSRDFSVTTELERQLKSWLLSAGLKEGSTLRVQDREIDVIISWKKQKQLHGNYFCSMPALAYSLTDNPLHSVLVEKAAQLKSAGNKHIRCLLIADAGSTLLRRLADRDPLRLTVSAEMIIDNFLRRNPGGIDVVCVFSPRRENNLFARSLTTLTWNVNAFVRPDFSSPLDGLSHLAAALPRPRFEGYQARSLQQQSAFKPNSLGWYMGTNIESSPAKMMISISARALLDLLAGRITPEQFGHMIGMPDEPNRPNLFKHYLESGQMMSAIRIVHGGLDEDDDRLEVEFSYDVAAAPLSLQPSVTA